MDDTTESALCVLLYLHLETFFLLIERKLLTGEECLQRFQRVHDAAASQPELKAAAGLIEGAVVLLRRLVAAGWPGPDAQKAAKDFEDAKLSFLATWKPGTAQ